MTLLTTEATLQAWVGVFGRLHPLLLHLPIGLLVAVALLRGSQWWRSRRADAAERASSSRTGTELAIGFLCWVAAFSALFSAAAGLVLAEEPDYAAAAALDLHRLLGLIGAGATLLVALTHGRERLASLHHGLLVFTLVVIGVAGHFGAELTHGAGFLTEPLRAREQPALPEPARGAASALDPTSTSAATPSDDALAPRQPPAAGISYRDEIAPILAAYCVSCHGETKRKGGLALHTPEWIRHGGGEGPVLATPESPRSELLRRVKLPAEHDDAMPPEGRARPTGAELELLERWIDAGAPFDAEAAAPAAPATPSNVHAAPAAKPAVAARAATAIDALRARLVHVQHRVPDSPLLWIDTAAVAATLDDERAREWLAPLADEVADLSLARAKVTDAIAPLLARMRSLQRLDLSATGVGAPTIRALAALPELRELVVTRMELAACTVDDLAALGALRELRAWNSGIDAAVLRELAARRPELRIDDGSDLRSKALETEAAVELTSGAPVPGASPAAPAASEIAAAKPVNDVCPVSGLPVKAGFTREYKGKLVGFCCPNCPQTFDANPEEFASKLR